MGDLLSSIENELIDIIKDDKSEQLKNFIIKNNINKTVLLGPHKRTLIQFCAYDGSSKCLEELIKMNFDINELETSNNNSPLFIACKFNYIEIVFILLNNQYQKCIILRKNNEGLNEFEVAFLRGNYEICYYLLYEYTDTQESDNNNEKDKKLNINNIEDNNNEINIIRNNGKENEYMKFFNNINFSLEKYLSMQEYLLYPLFNMPLFYHSLKKKIFPSKCPSFAVERKKTKELLTKIPDPNESWGNFIKRLTRLELYNPPLVDKNSVTRANSLYMMTQMKMISMEYGIPMDYCDSKDLKKNNDNKNENEEENPLNNNIDNEIQINEEKLDEINNDNNNNDNNNIDNNDNNINNINNIDNNNIDNNNIDNNNNNFLSIEIKSNLSKSSIDSHEKLNKEKNNTVNYFGNSSEDHIFSHKVKNAFE